MLKRMFSVVLSFLVGKRQPDENTLETYHRENESQDNGTSQLATDSPSTGTKKNGREARAERIQLYLVETKAKHRNNGKQERSPAAPFTGLTTRSLDTHRSNLTIDDLLPIDGLVPPGFDTKCVKAVIYWGFLHPAQEVPFLNGNYGLRERIIRSVGGKGYSFEQIAFVIKMLERQGLVLSHYSHAGRDNISLTTKPKKLMSPAIIEIARICSKAAFQLHRRA